MLRAVLCLMRATDMAGGDWPGVLTQTIILGMSNTTSQLFVPFSGQTFRSFSPTDSTSLFSGRLMEGND